MGLFDFVKSAGAKVFGRKDEAEEAAEAAQANLARATALKGLVGNLGFEVNDLDVEFAEGVAQVDDRLTVEKPAPEATFYTVQRGDSLSKIAKAHYGNAMKYPVIFEANRPMLSDPDKIYPGQVLRIPPQE